MLLKKERWKKQNLEKNREKVSIALPQRYPKIVLFDNEISKSAEFFKLKIRVQEYFVSLYD